MLLLLDSNTFITDPWLHSERFKLLEDNLDRLGGVLCLPAVVVAEVKNKHRERLKDNLGKLEKANRELFNIAREEPLQITFDMEAASKKHGSHLDLFLGRVSAEQVPVPAGLTHMRVVERALGRKKPFDENGDRGYRDTIIWETVLSLKSRDKQEIVLVARDKDFGTKEGLHPELRAEFDAAQGTATLSYFHTLDDFVRERIHPLLHRVEGVQSKLVARGIDLKELIGEALTDEYGLIDHQDVQMLVLGYRHAALELEVRRDTLHSLDVRVADALEHADGSITVYASAEFAVRVHVYYLPGTPVNLRPVILREWRTDIEQWKAVEVEIELLMDCSVVIGPDQILWIEASRLMDGEGNVVEISQTYPQADEDIARGR